MSSRFSRIEAFASELQQLVEEMFLRYCMDGDTADSNILPHSGGKGLKYYQVILMISFQSYLFHLFYTDFHTYQTILNRTPPPISNQRPHLLLPLYFDLLYSSL